MVVGTIRVVIHGVSINLQIPNSATHTGLHLGKKLIIKPETSTTVSRVREGTTVITNRLSQIQAGAGFVTDLVIGINVRDPRFAAHATIGRQVGDIRVRLGSQRLLSCQAQTIQLPTQLNGSVLIVGISTAVVREARNRDLIVRIKVSRLTLTDITGVHAQARGENVNEVVITTRIATPTDVLILVVQEDVVVVNQRVARVRPDINTANLKERAGLLGKHSRCTSESGHAAKSERKLIFHCFMFLQYEAVSQIAYNSFGGRGNVSRVVNESILRLFVRRGS